MSRLEELKKKNGGATLSKENTSSRLQQLKEKSKNSTISSDGSDIKNFISDYESFMQSDYDENKASDLRNRLTELNVRYNLNRSELSEKEKEVKSYLG